MGLLQRWSEKQVRKRDVRASIQETHFEVLGLRMLMAALRMTEEAVTWFDPGVLQRFDKNLLEYMRLLISGLRHSEARLWGFKGNRDEWTDSVQMIASEKVRWNEDRRERLLLAIFLECLRSDMTEILLKFESGALTAEETRASIKSTIDSFCDRQEERLEVIENDAHKEGLFCKNRINKLKEIAEKRVGTGIRGVLREAP